MSLLHTIAPALFVLLWSSGFVAAKLAIPFAEPCTFLFLRFSIVVLVLLPIVLMAGEPPSARRTFHTIVGGALMQGLYLSCVVWSIYLGMPAGVVALTVSLHPITTAILASLFLGDRISALGWLGFVLGMAGAVLVLWPQLDLDAGNIRPLTIALCLCALPCMSCGTVYQKRFAPDVGPLTATCVQHIGALFVTGAGALLIEKELIDWTPLMVGSLLWQALVVSVGAVALLLLMLGSQSASRVSSVFYMVPAGSAGLTFLLLGENLELLQIAGMVVVTGAVILIGIGGRQGPVPKRPAMAKRPAPRVPGRR